MKHASDQTLDQIETLLSGVRQFTVLTEKKRGTFYKKSSAFLHFHEDPAGIFADLKTGLDWERYQVGTPGRDSELLKAIARLLHEGR